MEFTPIKISSGPVDVIHSGSVITFADNPLHFTFGPEDDIIDFFVEFVDEGLEFNEPSTEWELNGDTKLTVRLYNFRKTPIGIGLGKPVQVGEFFNRKLYLNFRVYSLSESTDVIFYYTFYLGGEEGING